MAFARVTVDRILCPVDFSELSPRALDHAVRLGRWFDARVTVLHIVPTVLAAVPPILIVRELRPAATDGSEETETTFRRESCMSLR